MRVLALDVGSSSVKAALWNGSRFSARSRIPYATHFDGPRAELHPPTVLAAILRAGRELHATRADAISFCTLSSAVVVAAPDGKPLLPIITHQDRRSVAEASELVRRLGQRWLLHHTGNLPYPGGIGTSTLAWIAQHHPDALRPSHRIGQLSTLVGHLLTGQWAIDPSQAVFLGLWDIRRWQWNQRLCSALGIHPDALPRCAWADTSIGGLNPKIARQWGVPAGIPVIGGFVDTSAAVLQTPLRAGQLTHNSGSTDVLALCVNHPHPQIGVLTRPVGTHGGPWLAVRTIAASGSALAWARRELFPAATDAQWNRLTHSACMAARDPSTVTCDAAFSGNRAALQQSAGATFTGITLATTNTQLLAAIVRGLVAESAANYATLVKIHAPARDVFFMGSASDVATNMHRAWHRRHSFRRLTSDSMAGLVSLANRSA